MAEYDYDLFVIGAGSGGIRAARVSASVYGAKVAIAEEYRVGGTCQIRGCIPKKFLVYASEYGHSFHDAKGYGWDADNLRLDWGRLIQRKSAEIDRIAGFSWRNLENAGVEIIEDRAVFEGPHTLRLVRENRTVTAKHILIAVGATPYRPLELEGQEHAITSDEVFHAPTRPEHVIVAGGGYIACEFACIFNGLGAEACLVYRGDTVLRGFDMDVRMAVHSEMKRKGVRVITHAVFDKIEKLEEGRYRAHISDGSKIEADCIMFAIGRVPKVEGLGLEAAGVQLTDKGAVAVDEYSKTSVDHIYAVGDVTDRLNLTPVAIREGQAFAHTVFGNKPTAFDHEVVASAVFTQPPAGVVGDTEGEARRKYGAHGVDIYKTSFRPMKHMLTGDEERVMMKLVVRKADDVVVGCHIVGMEAGELIQAIGIAVKAGLTKAQWDDTCAVHPTIAEELVLMREPYVPPELKAAE